MPKIQRRSKTCKSCRCRFTPDCSWKTKRWQSLEYHSRECAAKGRAGFAKRQRAKVAEKEREGKQLIELEGKVPVYRVPPGSGSRA